jgi:1,2-phenylacetyl-CoA epoxidase catalytic subunit
MEEELDKLQSLTGASRERIQDAINERYPDYVRRQNEH